MGILANTVSISQFRVLGDVPDNILNIASEALGKRAFQSIDHNADEVSVGWVSLDDADNNDFSNPETACRDTYLTFSLRKDERKIPAPLLRRHFDLACKEFMETNPGLKGVPKRRKEEIRENVRLGLLKQTLPIPSTFDAVWDTDTQMVTLSTLSGKNIELFETLFKATFEGLRLVPVTPYSRAEQVVSADLAEALTKANRASNDSILDMIENNTWLGTDFLRWVLYQTIQDSDAYKITQEGPASKGDTFVAYINDKLTLLGQNEDGAQKIVVSGPQNKFGEVQTALEDGKVISEATVYLERDEDIWKLTLKGDRFHFASLKSPGVKLEKDDVADEDIERQAVFFVRMLLLSTAQQLFDSLFSAFLKVRLTDDWADIE